ncbi:hypothetical protein TVAG_400220 [Trichomonas vaginalis G3]|uniref:CWH43-like N-terminal domain-containing protein n=1 Tax=Trichomonas vaginalis (strain ATCC PRA-98 / G3) TaxID=412133 RepID=A2F7E4_TRIV3|nr:hypothetical protein TVAGG3_0224430 [Trichomonas vaginalis G3]EAX99160.1 hypothetical protein TVAG_400220 [Trichomonas vaginalis G3]KAI5552168.1 hypothetical protein TVAGG3_0224430 [Trichomonas vaginalis G3]|eukprot:XP_001312090.1 hypothetical protein [Trichomonas vaginalis G3]
MKYQPEGKTVNIALSITSLVLFIINYTRIKAIRVLRRLKPKMSEKKYKPAMMTLTISGYISVSAHFLMTFFSAKEFSIPHSIFLNITYISGVVNMFATDITLKTIYLSSKNFSRVLSMISFAVVLSFTTLRYYVPLDPEDTIRLTIANLFGIFSYICYYLKIFLVKYDIPDIGIRVSQRIKF